MAKTAQEIYDERKKRVLDIVSLKVPDRIPMYLSFSTFGTKWAGITVREAFENIEKWSDINEKMFLDLEPDFFFYLTAFSIAANETLGTRNYNWPGHGLPDTSSIQYVESEYMKKDEYDAILSDSGDYIFRTYLPRVYGSLEGLGYLPQLTSLLSYSGLFSTFGNPAALDSLETMIKAIRQNREYMERAFKFTPRMEALGFPQMMCFSLALAPFDLISDYLRGMKGCIFDMFQRPEKLLALEELIIKQTFAHTVEADLRMNRPFHFIATHRGSDGFMSKDQFEKFYWPGLKKILLALIDAGMTPFIFWEGTWDQRLPYLRELPRGKVIGWFDRTDIFKAKKVIGDTMCICGDMPLSLLQTGTPQQVKDYSKRLIDEVGYDGGYMMGANTTMDNASPALVREWVNFTHEYGVYH